MGLYFALKTGEAFVTVKKDKLLLKSISEKKLIMKKSEEEDGSSIKNDNVDLDLTRGELF